MELKFANKINTFAHPIVMGIINCTPDSFFEGSRKQLRDDVLQLAARHLKDGASILDLGAFSTRPGIDFISEHEELNRIKEPLKWITSEFPEAWISVDTFRASVADFCLQNGAHIINDISGGQFDEQLLDVVSRYQCPYIAMHLQGTPETMHQDYVYEDISKDVIHYFEKQITKYRSKGIQQLILDPGFGFSKSMNDNFRLLAHLKELKTLSLPVLAGISRKRMIWKTLESSPEQALNGTTVLNTIALLKGADILRVHDVREAVEAVRLVSRMHEG